MSYYCTEAEQKNNSQSLPAQINWLEIDVEAYKEALKKVDWKETFTVPDDQLSPTLIDKVCSVVLEVKVPMYRDRIEKKVK